jgi:hypothetical protein
MQAPGVRDIMDMQEFFVGRYSGGEFECLHGTAVCRARVPSVCVGSCVRQCSSSLAGPGECVGDLFLLCAHNLTVLIF